MANMKSVKERVQRSRTRASHAGLKRVEVLVPADKADLVRAYAANLREDSNSEVRRQLRQLLKQAYNRFHARCLDNIDIDPEKADLADAAIVAAALMNRGNADAYNLGRRIQKLAR